MYVCMFIVAGILIIVFYDIISEVSCSISLIPLQSLWWDDQRGIFPAIIGTFVTAITAVLAVPLGMGVCGSFKWDAPDNILLTLFDVLIRNLSCSLFIVYGLFVVALFVEAWTLGFTILQQDAH